MECLNTKICTWYIYIIYIFNTYACKASYRQIKQNITHVWARSCKEITSPRPTGHSGPFSTGLPLPPWHGHHPHNWRHNLGCNGNQHMQAEYQDELGWGFMVLVALRICGVEWWMRLNYQLPNSNQASRCLGEMQKFFKSPELHLPNKASFAMPEAQQLWS